MLDTGMKAKWKFVEGWSTKKTDSPPKHGWQNSIWAGRAVDCGDWKEPPYKCRGERERKGRRMRQNSQIYQGAPSRRSGIVSDCGTCREVTKWTGDLSPVGILGRSRKFFETSWQMLSLGAEPGNMNADRQRGETPVPDTVGRGLVRAKGEVRARLIRSGATKDSQWGKMLKRSKPEDNL